MSNDTTEQFPYHLNAVTAAKEIWQYILIVPDSNPVQWVLSDDAPQWMRDVLDEMKRRSKPEYYTHDVLAGVQILASLNDLGELIAMKQMDAAFTKAAIQAGRGGGA